MSVKPEGTWVLYGVKGADAMVKEGWMIPE